MMRGNVNTLTVDTWNKSSSPQKISRILNFRDWHLWSHVFLNLKILNIFWYGSSAQKMVGVGEVGSLDLPKTTYCNMDLPTNIENA